MVYYLEEVECPFCHYRIVIPRFSEKSLILQRKCERCSKTYPVGLGKEDVFNPSRRKGF